MIYLTEEQARQIEEIVEHLLVDHPTARHHKACVEALSIIRAARAQEQAEQEPAELKECRHCESSSRDWEDEMNKTTEALKMAEEALVKANHFHDYEDELAAIREALAEPVKQNPVAFVPDVWKGSEEWMPLAFHLCAEEWGEDECNTLLWDGGVIPEPWGERWLRYEDEAKRIIELVRTYTAPIQPVKQEPVAWKHDCAALLANGVELWIDHCPHCGKPRNAAPVQPVKQEPVAWTNYNGAVNNRLKGAPVDAKAIRAEALEEAAKFAYKMRFRSCWTAEAIADGIRGLK